MEYRKEKDTDTWHWCRNCPQWPTSAYDAREEQPADGGLCTRCMVENSVGNCVKQVPRT